MKQLGIGLPGAVPGADRRSVLDWATRAEGRGFATLSAVDRLVYASWEPLVALAAAGAVTERIGLMTTVVTVPNRGNAALLAKQAATVQELSDGRLRLGVGLGARRDDFGLASIEVEGRGASLDTALAVIDDIWAGRGSGSSGTIGPVPTSPPGLMIGGFAPPTFRRVARYGAGWIGAGPPAAIAAGAQQARDAWAKEGRAGQPHIAAIVYFGLGPNARHDADVYLTDYYSFAGDSEQVLPGDSMSKLTPADVAGSALVGPDAVRGAAQVFAESGCDELIFLPTSTDPDQVDMLADVLDL